MGNKYSSARLSTLSNEIEKLNIECTDHEPIQMNSFLFSKRERSQFDMHYCMEMGIVVDGCMDRFYESGKFRYESGEVWFCGMWEPHGWGVEELPCEAMVFFIHPPLLYRVSFPEPESVNWMTPFIVSQRERPRVPEGVRPWIIEAAHGLQKDKIENPSMQETIIQIRLLEILVRIFGSWKPGNQTRKTSGGDMEYIGRAMQIIFESTRHLPVQEVADQCGINRNTLSGMFKEYMGLSFSEFALRYRTSSAAHYLKNTDEPIKAIASEWGFSDTSHFYRCFDKYYGCSPVEYRTNARG